MNLGEIDEKPIQPDPRGLTFTIMTPILRVMRNLRKTSLLFYLALSLAIVAGCQTSVAVKPEEPVALPFLKNTPNECYFLDDFMPTPERIVSGRSGSAKLRYYVYKIAKYKDTQYNQVVLAFYSGDDRCWSLYEERYIRDNL